MRQSRKQPLASLSPPTSRRALSPNPRARSQHAADEDDPRDDIVYQAESVCNVVMRSSARVQTKRPSRHLWSSPCAHHGALAPPSSLIYCRDCQPPSEHPSLRCLDVRSVARREPPSKRRGTRYALEAPAISQSRPHSKQQRCAPSLHTPAALLILQTYAAYTHSRQYLLLSSFVHTASLKGLRRYKKSYVSRTLVCLA